MNATGALYGDPLREVHIVAQQLDWRVIESDAGRVRLSIPMAKDLDFECELDGSHLGELTRCWVRVEADLTTVDRSPFASFLEYLNDKMLGVSFVPLYEESAIGCTWQMTEEQTLDAQELFDFISSACAIMQAVCPYLLDALEGRAIDLGALHLATTPSGHVC